MLKVSEKEAEWIYRVVRALGQKQDKEILWQKALLFKRGLKTGSIYFLGENLPAVKLPDWYLPLASKKKWSRAEEKRMLSIVEERQAFFYLLNDLQALETGEQSAGIRFI